jgi:hypothetical protein
MPEQPVQQRQNNRRYNDDVPEPKIIVADNGTSFADVFAIVCCLFGVIFPGGLLWAILNRPTPPVVINNTTPIVKTIIVEKVKEVPVVIERERKVVVEKRVEVPVVIERERKVIVEKRVEVPVDRPVHVVVGGASSDECVLLEAAHILARRRMAIIVTGRPRK